MQLLQKKLYKNIHMLGRVHISKKIADSLRCCWTGMNTRWVLVFTCEVMIPICQNKNCCTFPRILQGIRHLNKMAVRCRKMNVIVFTYSINLNIRQFSVLSALQSAKQLQRIWSCKWPRCLGICCPLQLKTKPAKQITKL